MALKLDWFMENEIFDVRQFRVARGLTQRRLADLCGVTLRTVQNWESGRNVPENIRRLIRAMADRGVEDPAFAADKSNGSIISYTKGVPYYDEDFVLGFNNLGFPSSENPEFLINMPRYQNATLWCNATGHSMEPEINNGDIVALELIEDISFLLMGEIYAIVTTNGLRTIKRLRRSGNSDSYLLVPTNPQYDTQEIPKSKILRVFRVLGNLHGF